MAGAYWFLLELGTTSRTLARSLCSSMRSTRRRITSRARSTDCVRGADADTDDEPAQWSVQPAVTRADKHA